MATKTTSTAPKITNWATPWPLFLLLDAQFKFTLDPCASDDNHKCDKYFIETDDGLSQNWDNDIVFCNPPYGKGLDQWIKKGAESKGVSVFLIPPRTDTAWWYEYVSKATEVWFLKGRVPFIDPTSGQRSSPLDPSCIVLFEGHSPVWNKKESSYVPFIKFWDWKNEIPEIKGKHSDKDILVSIDETYDRPPSKNQWYQIEAKIDPNPQIFLPPDLQAEYEQLLEWMQG